MKLIIDLLGADAAPEEIMQGICNSLKKTKLDFVLVGPKDRAIKVLKERNIEESRFEFIDTNEYIKNEEEPVRALRIKKDSSLVLGLNRLNEDGDGFLSAGSTGALISGGIFITKRLENVHRATLSAFFTNKKGRVSVLVDCGSIVDSKPEMLNQFATMGSVAAENYLKYDKPKVYLANVGTEDAKGDKLSKEAFALLKENKNINFCGNLEARDFLTGKADVIVADGFAGNMMLKASEGAAIVLFDEIKEQINKSFRAKLGALLLKPALMNVKNKYDHNKVGAGVILGLRKPLFKAHGNSDKISIEYAIYKAEEFMESKITEKLEGRI